MHVFNEANPPIIVRTIYTPGHRIYIRKALSDRLDELQIGMTYYHSEITGVVKANSKRVVSHIGVQGVFTDQLSVRNLYHFFEGRRTHDTRMQILDAYEQLMNKPPGLITVH